MTLDPISKTLKTYTDPAAFIDTLCKYGYLLKCEVGIFNVTDIRSDTDYHLALGGHNSPMSTVRVYLTATCYHTEDKWSPVSRVAFIDKDGNIGPRLCNIVEYNLSLHQGLATAPIAELELTLEFLIRR